MHPGNPANGTVYFEFRALGGSVRVAAIDAASGIEVAIVGPASARQTDLETLARAKLAARLRRGGG